MKFARGLLIFSYGLFTIAAQTLLFREFITTFEGNDISVGVFFGCWFMWVGLGAILVNKAKTLAEKLLKNIEFLFFGYLPAFVLELILIVQARELAGIESYALMPIQTFLLLSIVVNAPISIITGMLFPIACRWVRQDEEFAVSRVYIFEAAGSFLGGLGVTILLGLGVSPARVFFILAFIVSLSSFCVRLAKAKQHSDAILEKSRKIKAQLAFLIPLCVLLCLATGVDKALMGYVRTIKWTKLLPKDALIGSFRTAQAEYLYGVYQGQWVAVREGSVCEALPDESTAGRIAAISLCQKPDASNVLVIGSGLGLCREILRLPQTEHVTWAHSDNEYVQEVNKYIPPELKISDERFGRLAGDVRSLLAKEKQFYDIVIVNLPEATSSVLNRYYTLEFYHQIKDSLRPNGLLAVSVPAGENIMGTELINLGASTKLTLQKVFSNFVLIPGEDTWFIASDSKSLTGEPGTLRDRFAAIDGAIAIFSPQALLSVYLPDRAAAALQSYSTADLPEELLVNRDGRPLTHLYNLLLAAKQSEAPITKFVKYLALAGPLPFFVPLLVFIALRIVYVLGTGRGENPSSFDSTFLVFSAGTVSIGVVIVLMYLFQTRFGSLYLHIGVISSVFMVGLTIGAAVMRHFLTGYRKAKILKVRPEIPLIAVILGHSIIIGIIACWPSEQWTQLTFAIAFVLCGVCAGCYFPLAAAQLADSAFEAGQVGSKLEMADHIGASAGGLLTGLALVPVLGAKVTLLAFALLILVNVPLAGVRISKPERIFFTATGAFRLRRLGYILFGIGVSVVLCSNLLAGAGRRLRPSVPQDAAQALAGELQIKQASTVVREGTRKLKYFIVYESEEKIAGYIFSSEDMAPEVRGFGGRMNLAIYVDLAGKLIDFHIVRSNETPAYLELLGQWPSSLNGRQLFGAEPFADVGAVTGATVSSKAILSALQTSGHRFARQILGQTLEADVEKKSHWASYLPDAQGTYLISAFILTLTVIYYGGFWSRLATLCFTLAVGGMALNAQYSSEQIATLLSLHTPAIGLSGAFLLVIGIPLLVIFFGNIYCGYICPFGAAQEMLGYIVPDRFKPLVSAEKMRMARFIKYVVLFVLIIVFFVSRNRTTLATDLLIKIFNFQFLIHNFQSSILLITAIALIGSVFYTRFWCLYLCPVGAFLSLLNKAVILKRYLPVKKISSCEFGLGAKDKMDCLGCDRCRWGPILRKDRKKETHYEPMTAPEPERLQGSGYAPMKLLSRYFVAVVLIAATFVSAVSVSRFSQVTGAGFGQPAVSISAGGQSRDVDLQRIRKMIRQKKLSDREAEFYKTVE